MCGSGQCEDQGSVQLLRLSRQNRLWVIKEASELGLYLRAAQRRDEPQSRALNTKEKHKDITTTRDSVRRLEVYVECHTVL